MQKRQGLQSSSRSRSSGGSRAIVEDYVEGVLSGRIVACRLVRQCVQRYVNDCANGGRRGLVFRDREAERAARFFSYLKHSKGEWAGKELVLAPWQQFVNWNLFGWYRGDGLRRFRKAYNEVARKNGKALSIDTLIPTVQGWRALGDLKPGDQVFDERGIICGVTHTSEIMHHRPCYAVTFSDGAVIIADAEHEWWTSAKRAGSLKGKPKASWTAGRKRLAKIRTTREIADTLLVGAKREANHRIAVAKALLLPSIELPIPPYTLGAWLGDGSSYDAGFTCFDLQILEEIRGEGTTVRANTTVGRYRLGSFGFVGSVLGKARTTTSRLRALGVLSVQAGHSNKHIPVRYLRASFAQRLALVQGLMDTDGHCGKAGQCEFSTTNERLRDGMMDLLCGLGLKPKVKTCRALLNGRDCGPHYRVIFHAFSDLQVFRVPRKYARQKRRDGKGPTRSSYRYIVAAHPCDSVPVQCISVDSPSRLYLAGPTMIATHNSTWAAGIGNYLAFADNEPGAEVYAAATKKDQARIVHSEAVRMVKASPELGSYITVMKDSLTRSAFNQKFEPLGADEDTMDGLNPHGAIIDEVHAHKNYGVYDKIETAVGARRNPLIFSITTAGVDQTSLCWDLHRYTEQILDGSIEDDSFFGFIATMDEGDRWDNPEVWAKSNPNLGVSIKPDQLSELVKRAAKLPAFLNSFLRLHLNVWTQQVKRWIMMDLWDENAGVARTDDELKAHECYGGLDLSSVSDISAFILLFPDPSDPERLDIRCRFWCPEDRLTDSQNQYATQYQAWARDGLLLTTPGNAIDYQFIRAQIVEDATCFRLRELAVDRLFQGYQLAMELADEGLTVVGVGMGFLSMAGPAREFERLLLSKKLRHWRHPVLRWMAGNCAVKEDPAGNIKPDKAHSQGKIDGIVGLLIALDRVMRNQNGPSVYESRGLLAFQPGTSQTEKTKTLETPPNG